MNLESLHPAEVEDLFTRHGALAVTLSNAGDKPVLEPAPGETPLWADTRITGLFPDDVNMEVLTRDILESFNLRELPPHRMEDLTDRVWEREWLKSFKPMKFGRRLWVSPHHHSGPFNDDVVVRLDPGLAFGTGTHPTTALCLEWLDSLDLHSRQLLDMGCGSGILAVAALLLGAEKATAMDIDSQAITATESNAAANHVADRLTATLNVEDCVGRFDVVVANILAGPLVQLAPDLSAKVSHGGMIALSGILEEQADAVRIAYEPWIDLGTPVVNDGWVLLAGTGR